MLVRLPVLLLALWISCPAQAEALGAGAGECPETSTLDYVLQKWPYVIIYEGPFPETTEGARVTASLDYDKHLRFLVIDYSGETGRSSAAFCFDSRTNYTIDWVRHKYAAPIDQQPQPTVTKVVEASYVIREDTLVSSTADADPKLAGELQEDLAFVLGELLPCDLTSQK